jgi:ParB family chromosome partitioning protein
MARGKRTDLTSLTGDVGDNSPVDHLGSHSARSAPLTELTANPRNPRDDLGDLADLASIADIQLQPAVVVSAVAYRALYPDDPISTRYVVVNGCRRLAAAHKYGRDSLDIVVNDAVARDRATLICAAIAENVDRQDFDVLEEARAVEALVTECGRTELAAERLHRTKSWVSQRRALLHLAPELQAALRAGELAIRHARSLARVPLEQQVARWRATQDRHDAGTAGETAEENPRNDGKKRTPPRSRILATAVGQFESNPNLLVDALHNYLGDAGIRALAGLLQAASTTGGSDTAPQAAGSELV